MSTRNIIDEDACATCNNCSLLKPPPPGRLAIWELPAICAASWPYTLRFHNVISTCPQYWEKKA